MSERPPLERPLRAVARLTLECDSHCVFCAQEGLPAHSEPTQPLTQLHAGGAREVSFVGGEPALDPALPDLVAKARAIGFTAVGVQTNGQKLGTPGALAPLVRAGLTDVHLSLHGARREVHDYHTERPGSFARALVTLDQAREAGLDVVVATALTRSSYRVLSELGSFLSTRAVGAWCIEVLSVRGRAEPAFDRLVPRLSLAVPFALHAIDRARSLGIEAYVRGAPLCLLGPHADRALPGAPRSHAAPACQACDARAACPGLEERYLERFGSSELHAVPLPAAPPAGPLARLFVGPGELAPLRSSDAPRRQLGVIG